MDSILTTIKQMLGGAAEDTHFEPDIIRHINTAFSTLHQIGVGPAEGFMIYDEMSIWGDFISGASFMKMQMIITYVYDTVKLRFDPPTTTAHIEALKRDIAELEWRLSVAVD